MTFKRLVMLVLILIGMAGLGNNVAYAASLCVHPTGASRCFASIQAAVDAADSGDRIIIRAGKYVEQVTIVGKDLTLVGRDGAVIQAPAEMQDTQTPIFGFEGRPILLVTDGEVTIRDLTIDGVNSAENNPFLEGIVFLNAGGVIRNNVVKNVGFGAPQLPIDENGEPVYQGDAIVVINFSTVPRTVTIAENRIVNYNNNGILLDAEADFNDPSVANLTVHVLDNTVIASGPNEAIDQWGIFIGGFNFADPQFSITGTVRGNRIRDQITTGEFPLPGVGIVTVNPFSLEISNNVIENTNISIATSQAFGAQIRHNQFVGPGQNVFGSTGLLLSGSDISVIENRFRKLETGIMLTIEDPMQGSALNTALDDNRSENVGVDVLTGPGAQMMMAAASAGDTSMWRKLSRR
jgi:hypothetical protein